MAFNDSPIVDRSAEQSEESVLKTRLLFSKQNGFISHEINGTDDYGVDINCQLISNGNASANHFPIQIKSKNKYKETKIENEKHKLFSFNTSRLGACRT